MIREAEIPESGMRIASLLASGTELVCALGAGESLVARSHECDYPEWVRRLPALSRPTFDTSVASRQIDILVRERLRAGKPLYEVDEALLAALAPDVLITQTHCEVCAVTPADLIRATPLSLSRRQVVALATGTLHGILEGFVNVADVIERREAGERLVAEIRGRLALIQERVRPLPSPTIVCLEWIDPIFGMGNWGPELVAHSGGTELLGAPGEHSAAAQWEDVLSADPVVLLVAPCGFGIDRTLAEMPTLAAKPGWDDLRAVRAGRVIVADGNRYFNRSGPSVFETVEILAEILHPQEFPPRHENHAWQFYPARHGAH
jgi:iron complex transport system substrate-binding protein